MKRGHLEIELLGEHIATQAAHLDAATHRLLTDIRTFDQAGGWFRQGARSCAAWLSWRIGWDGRTARDRVRVANRLGELPLVDQALGRGELSYSKVRAITRVATPAIEATLVEYARYTTGAQLEKICRMYASVVKHDASKPDDDVQRRALRWRELPDGMVMLQGVFHPEDAALIKAAIERIAAEQCRDRAASNGAIRPASAEEQRDAANPVKVPPVMPGRMTEYAAQELCSEQDTLDARRDRSQGDATTSRGVDRPASGSGSAEPSAIRATDEEATSSTHESEIDNDDDGVDDAFHRAEEPLQNWSPDGSAEPSRPNYEVQRLAEQAGRARGRAMREAAAQRSFDRAGALVAMAQQVVRGTAKQRAPIDLVVTTTRDALVGRGEPAGDSPDAAVVDGLCISSATVRRLACDCSVTHVLEDEHGNAVSVGRRTRKIPGAMKAALLRTDQTCRFPGCNARAFLEGHHAVHWADGGRTELGNLMCLCGWHHRFVHEYGFAISMDANRLVTATDPRGRQIIEAPPRQVGPVVGFPLIEAANANLGITAETPWSGWNGEPIDYPACVDGVLAADQRFKKADQARG